MSDVRVDTDALRALAGRMMRTRDAVAQARHRVDVATPAAAGLVAGALADFDDHWRYGLQPLVDDVDACAQALRAAAARHALRTSDDPRVAETAHEQLVEALRRAGALRDTVEAEAAKVRSALAAACDDAPHPPGWFHRMLHDLSGNLHDIAASM